MCSLLKSMAGTALNLQGVATLIGQQPLPTDSSPSPFPSTSNHKKHKLRSRALKALEPSLKNLTTMQKTISLAVKEAVKEIEESVHKELLSTLHKELLSTLQPLIQKAIQETLQEPLREITNLLLKGGIESMNNSNSTQELIRQGLYNLENCLKQLITA